MMNNFVCTSQLRIFIFQCVKTMRAGCDYLFNSVAIQNLDIAHRLHLKQKLVAGTSGGISRTGLFSSENGEADTHCIQDFNKGSCHFFVPVVKRSGAAYPK